MTHEEALEVLGKRIAIELYTEPGTYRTGVAAEIVGGVLIFQPDEDRHFGVSLRSVSAVKIVSSDREDIAGD